MLPIILWAGLTLAQTPSTNLTKAQLQYTETLMLNCQANLSHLYQERDEMLHEIELGQTQAVTTLKKAGLKNPSMPKENVPFVLNQALDLEHKTNHEKLGDAFADWESSFFMKNAQPFLKACLTKAHEMNTECGQKKNSKECMIKSLPRLTEALEEYSPFLRYLNKAEKEVRQAEKRAKKKPH
ncbi:MAG: hypothetical protein ACOYL6_13125 [Bacteriovoracaceae bacterium]